MKISAVILSACLTLSACAAERRITGIQEASGIARAGDELLIVGDEEAGVYYRFPIPRELPDSTARSGAAGPRGFRIPLHPENLKRITWNQGAVAIDQESIGVLADGRVVILSERLRALWGADGVIAEYPGALAETGGRGLEGLAIRRDPLGGSRVAVLWEGGYPSFRGLPAALRNAAGRSAMNPVIVTHRIESGERGITVTEGPDVVRIELHVPHPASGDEPVAQRFRAPDFTWYRFPDTPGEEWGFLVLLSSSYSMAPPPGSIEECPEQDLETGEPLRFCFKWLQRFDSSGMAWGEPLDLTRVLPGDICDANWEGIDWYYGKRGASERAVVLTYERTAADLSEAYVLILPAGW
ncbi:MAG: hypothetical protein HKN20_13895 [Gemmatimonadetes bacterium]|nr:hypothetical protein [Gemmatimonadota bacterium]